jgi:hypothetical protein
VHRAEHPAQVLDVAEGVGGEDEIDRVGPHERQVGEVTVAELDAHLLALAEPAGKGELLAREVDPDRRRPGLGERNRALRPAAAELEDALALQVAEQAQLGLGGPVGSVVRHPGRQRRPLLVRGGEAVPGGGVVGRHAAILPDRPRRRGRHGAPPPGIG